MCSTKCSSETLQNLPYFINTKTQIVFSIWNEMKNGKNNFGFSYIYIYKIWQLLKCFAGTFRRAWTLKLYIYNYNIHENPKLFFPFFISNGKNNLGFRIYKIWQIWKRFAGTFHWAQTLKLWGVKLELHHKLVHHVNIFWKRENCAKIICLMLSFAAIKNHTQHNDVNMFYKDFWHKKIIA